MLTVDFWCEKVKLALLKKYCATRRISKTYKLFSFLLVLRTNASKFLGEKFFGAICSSSSQSCSSHDHFHRGHIHILSELVYLQLVNKTLTKIRNRSYIWIFFVKHSSEKRGLKPSEMLQNVSYLLENEILFIWCYIHTLCFA